jgi:copper homeostasis protein CutC
VHVIVRPRPGNFHYSRDELVASFGEHTLTVTTTEAA